MAKIYPFFHCLKKDFPWTCLRVEEGCDCKKSINGIKIGAYVHFQFYRVGIMGLTGTQFCCPGICRILCSVRPMIKIGARAPSFD